jgi:hypothetical protein
MARLRRAWVMKSPWSSMRANSHRFFGRHLESGEQVIAHAEAIFAATGALTATGVGIGVLCGALAWTLLNTAALWPLMVLGGLAGIIGGVLIAARRARSASGPGAAVVRLVLTNRRLLTLRQRSAVRFAPLRSHRLENVARIASRAARLGSYQLTAIELVDGDSMKLLVAGPHDFGEIWGARRPTVADRPDAEEQPSG